MSLRGKTILITGATGAIGRPLVEACSQAEATLAVTTRRLTDTAEMEQELLQRGINAAIFPCDLRYEEDVVRLVHRLAQRFGRIDVVINAAVIAGPRLSALDYPVDPWRDVIATNVTGTFLVCREVLPWMIRQRAGSIINITDSQAGSRGDKSAAYVVGVQTIDHLTRLLAGEVNAAGVRVNAVDIGRMSLISRRHEESTDWTEPFLWLAGDESVNVTGRRIQAKGFVAAE